MFRPVYMSDKRFDEISNLVLKSYPNGCILYIDEVVNPTLELQFESRKLEIARARGSVQEKMMFHGTKEAFIKTISVNGFDPEFNLRSAFGYGVYFARDASYSKDYMFSSESGKPTFMFVANVLIGKMAIGCRKGDPKFDNNVDRFVDPQIVTTVYPDGSLPKYIVAFHKEAR